MSKWWVYGLFIAWGIVSASLGLFVKDGLWWAATLFMLAAYQIGSWETA